MPDWNEAPISRRTALRATGGLFGGLALGQVGAAARVTTQSEFYRYDALEAQLVDIDTQPPQFRTVQTELLLTDPGLPDCNTDHPCSIDVLAYVPLGDDDDSGETDDTDDDGAEGDDARDDDDDDVECPAYAAVVLLCHGQTEADAMALTGLVPTLLADDMDDDFVVSLSPSGDTNIDSPEQVANPCPTGAGDAADDTSDDNGGVDDDDDGGADNGGGDEADDPDDDGDENSDDDNDN